MLRVYDTRILPSSPGEIRCSTRYSGGNAAVAFCKTKKKRQANLRPSMTDSSLIDAPTCDRRSACFVLPKTDVSAERFLPNRAAHEPEPLSAGLVENMILTGHDMT